MHPLIEKTLALLIEKEIYLCEELNNIKFELCRDEEFDWEIAFNMIDLDNSGFINQNNLNEFLFKYDCI